MTTYNQLSLMSFIPQDDFLAQPLSLYSTGLPDDWKRPLLELERVRSPRAQEVSLPIYKLNAMARALLSDVIMAFPYAGRLNSDRWLLARRSINAQAILGIVYTWVRSVYGRTQQVERILAQMSAGQILWTPVELDNLQWGELPNGTARLRDASQIQLPAVIAQLVADRLTADGVLLPHGTEQLHQFHRTVPTSNYQAEIMVWPPLVPASADGNHQYSPVLRWKVVNRPWDKMPLLICHYGIRRWCWKPGLAPSGKNSVYVRPRGSKMEEEGFAPHFGKAMFETYSQNQGSDRIWRLRWDEEEFGNLLQEYIQDETFTPETFRANPTRWMNGDQGSLDIAMVYNQTKRVKSDHWVTPGVMPGDRALMQEALLTYLPDFRLEEAAVRTVDTAKRPENVFAKVPTRGKDTPDEAYDLQLRAHKRDLRRHIVSATGTRELIYEIHYQSDATRDGLVDTLIEMFGLPSTPTALPQFPEMAVYQTDELRIVLRTERQTDLFALLGEGESSSNRTQLIEKSLVPLLDGIDLSMCLVELNNYKGQRSDPKNAIRLGYANTNRLTQFITPRPASPDEPIEELITTFIEEDDEDVENADEEQEIPSNWSEAAKKAVLDSLRQLGCYAPLPSHKNFRNGIYMVGVHMLRQRIDGRRNTNHLVPIVILAPPSGYNLPLQVYMPGHGDEPFSYPQALLELAKGMGEFSFNDIVRFLKDIFGNALVGQDALVIADAQRCRMVWTALQDGLMTTETVFFEPTIKGNTYSKLRFIRLRRDTEIPEAYGLSDEGVAAFGQGVFLIPRVQDSRGYFSSYGKPQTQQKVNSKMLAGDQPTWQTYSPRLVEMIIFSGAKPQEFGVLAGIIHSSRQSSATTVDSTRWPMPIHYADLMEEYLI